MIHNVFFILPVLKFGLEQVALIDILRGCEDFISQVWAIKVHHLHPFFLFYDILNGKVGDIIYKMIVIGLSNATTVDFSKLQFKVFHDNALNYSIT